MQFDLDDLDDDDRRRRWPARCQCPGEMPGRCPGPAACPLCQVEPDEPDETEQESEP